MALGNIIESFFVYLGFEVSTHELEEFSHHIEEAETIAAGLGATLIAVSGAVFAFVSEMSESVAELQEFSEINNVGIEDVQELGFAASVSGSSLEAMKQSLAGVNMIMGQAITGIGRGARFFAQFGFSAKDAEGKIKSTGDMMQEILAKAAEMSRPAALSMLRRLGLDPSLILLAEKGRDGLEKLRLEAKAYGNVSEEDAKRAVELKEAWTRLHYIGEQLGKGIVVRLIPGVLKVVEGFRAWILANKDLFAGGLLKFVEGVNATVGALWEYLMDVVHAVANVTSGFKGWKEIAAILAFTLASVATYGFLEFLGNTYLAVIKLVKGMIALDVASSALPLLIGAMALSIFLLMDDLKNFRDGNASVLGQLQKDYPNAIEWAVYAVEGMTVALLALKAEAIITFLTAAAAVWPLTLAVIALGVAWYELSKHWDVIGPKLEAGWANLQEHAEIFERRVRRVISALEELAGMAVNVPIIGSMLDGASGSRLSAFATAGGFGTYGAPSFDPSSMFGGGTSSVVHHSTTTIDAPITIQTNDPTAAGEAVHSHLEQLNRSSIRNGQSPVSH